MRSAGIDVRLARPRFGLLILTLVYVSNFVDRRLLSILNEDVKADLGLDDAQMGFLYGTSFAVFYALFGIPFGRLADAWQRPRLIACGLAAWSLFTALSGCARNFLQLAALRTLVGVGEASATPAAYSLIADWYAPRRRALAVAIYSCGIYLGIGVGLALGGVVVDGWERAWEGSRPPLGLAGWQVAFIAAGTPGLLLALWVRRLVDPARPAGGGVGSTAEDAAAQDGSPSRSVSPWRILLRETSWILPPCALLALWRAGASRRVLAGNLLAAAALAGAACALTAMTGDVAQWVALMAGLYALVSWLQGLALRDPDCSRHLLCTPALLFTMLAVACISLPGYGLGYWMAPLLIREHGWSREAAGATLGGIAAVSGLLGALLGGLLADRLRVRLPAGRFLVLLAAALLPVPFALGMLGTTDGRLAVWLYLPTNLFGAMWFGPGGATVQELVPARMRATASALYLLAITLIGLALGPYMIGKVSVETGELATGMRACVPVYGLGALCALAALLTRPRSPALPHADGGCA